MLRRFLMGTLMVMACALLTASRAKADTIDNFTFTGGSSVYTWSLPSSPVLSPGNFVDGMAFAMLDVAYQLNGVAQTPAEFDFYSLSNGGGFLLQLADLSMPLNEFGAQVYSGLESAPTFIPGLYSFIDPDNLATGTLAITAVSVSASESSSLVLTGLGLIGLLAFAARKRRGAMPAQLATA